MVLLLNLGGDSFAILESGGGIPDSTQYPALVYIFPFEMKYVYAKTDRSAESVQQQVDHLESSSRDIELVKFIRVGI